MIGYVQCTDEGVGSLEIVVYIEIAWRCASVLKGNSVAAAREACHYAMAAASAATVSLDYETFDEAAGLGLQKWFLAAAFLSAWDYALLLSVLSMIFVDYILDFHIVGDILRGWKGNAVSLYYDPKSPVSARLVAKCETLRKRCESMRLLSVGWNLRGD